MQHSPFLTLLLITGLALVVPLVASRSRRVRIPIVVGEILAGIVIGKSGLDLVEPSATLSFLAEFGFAYLMFLSGLEVDFNLLMPSSSETDQRGWARPLPMALIMLGGTLALAVFAAFGLERAGLIESPFLVGLILSTTSLGVVVPVLKERGFLGNAYGQTLLVAASIADFATLVLLTVVIAIRSTGLTLDLLLIPALLAIFLMALQGAYRFGSMPRLNRWLDEISSATAQIQVRGAFALMVAWVVLAEALGVELILGAFLAGAIAGIIGAPEKTASREKLDAIGYGFFIPIFFINVGVNFDLPALFGSSAALLLVPILILIAYAVKVLPALLMRVWFSWREVLAGGFLLSSRLSLIIAASAIALSIGAIDQATNSATILLAILSCTVSPLVFGRMVPVRKEAREGVIILGGDQMAGLLAQRLLEAGEKVVLVESDPEAVARLKQQNLPVLERDPSQEAALKAAGAASAEALVGLCSMDESSMQVCALARERYGIPNIVARVSEVGMIAQLHAKGVKVIQPALATAIALEGALRFPTAFQVLADRAEEAEVGEGKLQNPAMANRPLRMIQLPGNAMILSLQRDGSVIVPDAETVLRVGDCVALIGSRDSVERALAVIED
ncbi:MAG: cation:proton antiporter [Anaerolineales bacterium]|jgi:Kef-type K+ transport system membrane component KefB/Trk K+ transport system NAD-binding subunit